VQREVFDFAVEAGANEEEAYCVALALSEDAESMEEVSDRTASYPSFGSALAELAPDCASAERYNEIDASYEEAFLPDPDAVEAGRRDLFLSQFYAAGASPAEAECMADALATAPAEDIPPTYGVYEPGDAELAFLDDCADPERIVELYSEAYRSPLRTEVVAAGATESEADCIIESIDQLDLFMPSHDFRGDDEAQITADLFVDYAGGCAAEGELRTIALEMHRRFEAEN
jgi:hypothetical protein